MHIQFQLVQQCIQISTRINSTNVHTYILRLFYIASSIRIYILIDPFLQGFVTQNATFITLLDCSTGTIELKGSSYFTSNYIYMSLDQFNGAIPNKRKCGTTCFSFALFKKFSPHGLSTLSFKKKILLVKF